MKPSVSGFDYIVLVVKDVEKTRLFYESIVGMKSQEERHEKWALHFGNSKISLQNVKDVPEIAKATTPGSGNFCLLSKISIQDWVKHLNNFSIPIIAGPGERIGAIGKILSVYFYDPDGNLVEISNQL